MDYNHFNPSEHKGFLPVRVLSYNYLDWFENITPDFKFELKGEMDYDDLKAGIKYHISQSPINEIACLNSSGEIELNENFNQYLWCVCYALLVLFDECIHKPITEGRYTGEFDFKNAKIKDAVAVFNNGFDLLRTYKEKEFFELPNPEKYSEDDKYYIERANSMFTGAMTFILIHEFGHQYFGHLKYTSNSADSKKEEYLADEYAIDKMAFNFSSERGPALKFGIVVGLCSLIFLSKSVDGGDEHPDIDDRLKVALEKLELDEVNNLWGISCLAFRLWAIKYNIKFNLPPIVDTYKELFEITLKQIQEIQK